MNSEVIALIEYMGWNHPAKLTYLNSRLRFHDFDVIWHNQAQFPSRCLTTPDSLNMKLAGLGNNHLSDL